MIEHEAIKAILAMNSSNEINGSLLSAGVRAMPNDVVFRSLEGFGKRPWRRRGRFETSEIGAFLKYFTESTLGGKTKMPRARVFVQPNKGEAQAILDYGNISEPGWCDHVGRLKLKYAGEFVGFSELLNQRAVLSNTAASTLKQREFIDLVADMWEHLTFTKVPENPIEHGADISPKHVMAAIRHLSSADKTEVKKTTGDFEQSGSVLNEIKVTSPTDNIPGYMSAFLPVFEGMKPKRLEYRISIMPEKLDIKITPVRRHIPVKQVAMEIWSEISGVVPADQIHEGEYTFIEG